MKFELITIDKKELKKLDKMKTEFNLESITVEDTDQYQRLTELLKKVKTEIKIVTDFFKEPKSQAWKNHREISDLEKQYKDHLTKFEKVAKDAIAEFMLDLEEQTGQDSRELVPKVEGISTTDIWKWEIVDKDKIPKQYWIVDEKQINEIVKATNGTFPIDGIRIYKEKSVRVKG